VALQPVTSAAFQNSTRADTEFIPVYCKFATSAETTCQVDRRVPFRVHPCAAHRSPGERMWRPSRSLSLGV
jgi:hypothetical protein